MELNANCGDGGPEGSEAEWQSFGAALAGLRKQNGDASQYASAELRGDRDMVLEAVGRMAVPCCLLLRSCTALAILFWKK